MRQMRRSAFLAAAPSGASLPGRLGPGSSLGGVVVFGLLLLGMAAPPVRDLAAQEVPDSTPERIPASVASKSSPGASRLPASLLLGVGFGRRSDPCAVCPSPENTDSFTGHVSLSRPLGHGFGVGVDGSVWRRSHPGPLGAPDSTGVPSPTKLGSTLGNVSVTFSFEIWQLFFQAGGGVAWASQDLVPGGGVATVGGAGGAAAGEGGKRCGRHGHCVGPRRGVHRGRRIRPPGSPSRVPRVFRQSERRLLRPGHTLRSGGARCASSVPGGGDRGRRPVTRRDRP